MSITTETPVGTIATEHPLATRVFARHGIDFCCGGGSSLGAVCAERGLDADQLLGELTEEARAAGPDDATRWDLEPLGSVIDHILQHYHVPLKDELPRLLEMARKVHQVHSDKDAERLSEMLRVVLALEEDLTPHMQKEENVLFPLILSGRGAMAGPPISVMEGEHEAVGALLRRLRSTCDDYRVPAEACTTWRALWAGLEDLERSLHEHIHLENNVLHPRALKG